MLKNLFTFFKKLGVSNQETEDLNSTYFHEDLFRQVEFVPRESINYLRAENNKIAEFAQKHAAENGFTDIYMRSDTNEINIAEKNIRFNEINVLLINSGMRKIENVYYFYGSTEEKCKNTVVFELKSAEIFVVFEHEFVKDFFINGFRFHENEEDKSTLQSILFKIGTKFSLVLNDWDLTEVIDLENQYEIKKYLNEGF